MYMYFHIHAYEHGGNFAIHAVRSSKYTCTCMYHTCTCIIHVHVPYTYMYCTCTIIIHVRYMHVHVYLELVTACIAKLPPCTYACIWKYM